MNEDEKNAAAARAAQEEAWSRGLVDHVNNLDGPERASAKALVSLFALMYTDGKQLNPSEKYDAMKNMLDIYRLEILIELAKDLLEIDIADLKPQIALLALHAVDERNAKARVMRNFARSMMP